MGNFSKPSAKFFKVQIDFFLHAFLCNIHVFTTAISKISSIANLRYHLIPFRRDVTCVAIWSDKSMPDFPLLYAKIAKGFSIFLRDQRCLTLKVLSTVDVCGG